MNSRERLLAALRGDACPDRVPVTLYEHSPFNGDWANAEPSYAPLLELERRYGDSFVAPPVAFPVFLGDPNVVVHAEERAGDGAIVHTRELHTPKGRLRTIVRRDPGLMTNWQIEPLVKSDADIERVLSMPDPPLAADAGQIRELDARVGPSGILCFSIGDAIGHVAGLFEFRDFALRCHRDDPRIRALVARAQHLVLRVIAHLGGMVRDAVFRLWGPEYCGEPLMNPTVQFHRHVLEQDREATAAIHATGNLSVVHCHGKLRALLDMIAEIGADALEPLELLPSLTADVALTELAERVGGRMCLMGGVQAVTLETGRTEEVETEVKLAIETLGRFHRFVVLPTSAPFRVPLEAGCLANCEAMYRAAHRYGRLA